MNICLNEIRPFNNRQCVDCCKSNDMIISLVENLQKKVEELSKQTAKNTDQLNLFNLKDTIIDFK